MATREVPGSYATITLALAAAANDDTINIAAGTYEEAITCGTLTGVTIQGATEHAESIIIISSGSSTATVLMNTNCILKNVTVNLSESSGHTAPGYNDLYAIDGVGGGKVYHVQNVHIYSNRNGVKNQAAGSTLDRCIIKFSGPRAVSSAGGTPGDKRYVTVGTYPSDATCTSCLFVGWPDGGSYDTPDVLINCTYTQAVSAYNSFGFRAPIIRNCLVHLDSGSVATEYAAGRSGHGYSGNPYPHAGIYASSTVSASISHGWAAGAGGDYVGSSADSYDTGDVETAGNVEALYVSLQVSNQSASYDENMRIRSGSLAYRAATNAPSDQPVYDLDGKPFHPTTPSIGCYEYCFGHVTSGVSVKRQSGSLGVGSTYIKSIMGVAT